MIITVKRDINNSREAGKMISKFPDELEKKFAKAEASDAVEVHLAFAKELSASQEPEVIEYYYELLGRTKNNALLDILRRFFDWQRAGCVPAKRRAEITARLLNDLEIRFKTAESTDDIGVHLDFKTRILASQEPEIIDYHYRLLTRVRNDGLFNILARFFEERRELGKQYLLNKIADEKDPRLVAAALQILGNMRGEEALKLARTFIAHREAIVRERACIVLGWVGNAQDIVTLARLQREEPDADTRKWAATQQMHIWFRFPEVKDAVIANLLAAIEKETNPEAVEMIVYTTQQILKRHFGLKNDPESPRGRMLGDLNEAKRRATVALKNYINKKSKKDL